MRASGRALSNYLLLAAICALPGILIFSSFRTFRELDEQKQVYLRHRVAQVAARLETIEPGTNPDWLLSLQRDEPNLRDLRILSRNSPAGRDPALQPIWRGEELYHTEFDRGSVPPLYRAYVPFHSTGGLHIAVIDLDARAADFLLVHARHNILTAMAGGVALILVSLYAVWIARRSGALERRQVELEHLARLGRLSAVLAHEIRNPLGTIKGFAQLAVERSDPATAGMLEPVLSETARLENLVNDLLAYGRPPQPEEREVHWGEIADALEKYLARNASAGISWHVDDSPIHLRTDPAILVQILLNLIKNANEALAAQPGAELRVFARAIGRDVEIKIQDNGPGIPESAKLRIFEPFFTTKVSGTGLGLAISRQLAAALHGELELHTRESGGVESVLLLKRTALLRAAPETTRG